MRVVFVHGWATDERVFDSTARGFDGSCCPRLPGHGRGKDAARWDEPTLSPAVRTVASAIEDNKSVAVGWSLGASVLISAAARGLVRPAGLVLVGATPRFVSGRDYGAGQPRAQAKRMIIDMKRDPAQTLARFYPLCFTDDEMKTEAAGEFIARYRNAGEGLAYHEITRALEALCGADLRAELAGLDLPVLVVHGTRDAVCPIEAGRFLRDEIKGARLVEIDGAGHAPFLTRAEEFCPVLGAFVDSL